MIASPLKWDIRIVRLILISMSSLLICLAPALWAADLRVSPNQRYLVKDGQPFFYLCDTGWDVFMMLDRGAADEYLQNRADKGFNVIMAILIGWKPFRDEANAYGEPPLIEKDPARPNEKYFQHVDYIVNKANSLGMAVAIAPAWSDWMYKNIGPGPHPFDVKNARKFGEYVGRRYKHNDVLWVIGGDRDPAGYEDILRAMVAGLDEGDGERDFLMTFHGVRIGKTMPPENIYRERLGSSHLFGSEKWLDFHGAYSGHQWAYPTYRLIASDRAMKPTRPVIDLEPCYENHAYHADGSMYFANPEKWDGKTRGTAALLREQAYWAMLAGAAGHNYCGDDVWQFHDPARPLGISQYRANTPWRQAMEFPGARQMGIMRRLFESRPWHTLEPDQNIIIAGQGTGEHHIQAARAADGKFLIVYVPRGNQFTIDMTKIRGSEATACWFNPRDGSATRIGRFPCRDTHVFSPPTHGVDNDWALVLDDVAQGFPPPGGTSNVIDPGEAVRVTQSDLDQFFCPPPEYADKLGDYRSPLKFYNGSEVKTPDDWQRRRKEILARWHEIMGPWPPLLEKPRIEYVKTERRENFMQHHIRVEVASDRMHPAILLVPDGEGPFPGVIVPYYDAETGAGLGKELRDFGYQLTRRGYVTLSIGGCEPRRDRNDEATIQRLSYEAYVGANCHSALANLPNVNAQRIGIVGHSYGGKWAMFASCLYDKFACAAWSDGGIVFDEKRANVNYWEPWYLGYEAGKQQRKAGIPSEDNPRTGAYKRLVEVGLDLHELHALMAPRPFLVSGGSEDQPERWQALNHSISVNNLLGYRQRVAMTNRNGHSPTRESNEQIYRFFEQFLTKR